MVRCKCWVRITCRAEPSNIAFKVLRLLEDYKQKFHYDIERNTIYMTLTDDFIDENIEVLSKLSNPSGFIECKCWGKNLRVKEKLKKLGEDVFVITLKESDKVRIRVIDASKTSSKTLELITKGVPVTIPNSLYMLFGEKLWDIYKCLKNFIKERLDELIVKD